VQNACKFLFGNFKGRGNMGDLDVFYLFVVYLTTL
jgi:hypothetical protein